MSIRALFSHPVWLTLILLNISSFALAGGTEFPGDGTRGLGRGGAIMTRPDDPFVMARNPALLADLWGSQLYFNTFIGMSNNCSQLSGGWGWGYEGGNSLVSMGKGEPPLFGSASVTEGSTGGPSNGDPVNISPSAVPYYGEPYPEICNESGASLIPNVILTSRINQDIGVGIGFMPPEVSTQRGQMGGHYGILDTENGKRPNPFRYMEPNFQDETYFGLLGAIGYKVLPWLRVGAGLRWTMVMANVQAWSNIGNYADPSQDIRSDFYGQDLFIPGFTTSVHAVPIDSLDIALGFRWEDRATLENSKIDVHVAPFSYYTAEDDIFVFQGADPNSAPLAVGGPVEAVRNNFPGVLKAPPPTVPQLSLGIRYADRIRPRPEKNIGLELAKDPMRDPMTDENWDIELTAIYYMTSVYDAQILYTDEPLRVNTQSLNVSGESGNYTTSTVLGEHTGGICSKYSATGECTEYKQNPKEYHGKDQISLRVGGDYNLFPNLLALRMGLSYETRGQEPGYARPTWSMPFERYGVHGGFTWRIDGRTDLSFAYAHFFQETIKLAINTSQPDSGFPRAFQTEIQNGQPVQLTQPQVDAKYHVVPKNEANAYAEIPIYSGSYQKATGGEKGIPARLYANAGTHKSGLDVVSISIMRHF